MTRHTITLSLIITAVIFIGMVFALKDAPKPEPIKLSEPTLLLIKSKPYNPIIFDTTNIQCWLKIITKKETIKINCLKYSKENDELCDEVGEIIRIPDPMYDTFDPCLNKGLNDCDPNKEQCSSGTIIYKDKKCTNYYHLRGVSYSTIKEYQEAQQ